MKLKVLLSLISISLFSSCSLFYKYNIGLQTVECPENAKERFGETKVIDFTENGTNKYKYEDDYICVIWYVDNIKFNFSLQNKTSKSIKLNWDDMSYVDINGNVGRVVHSGVPFLRRNESQPSINIPSKATINDYLIPTDNIYYLSTTASGWEEAQLLPPAFTKEILNSYIGKTMKILIPILIEDVQNEYVFTFSIYDIEKTTLGIMK